MNFLMKRMLESKMKDIPPAEREKVFAMFEQNPEFFQNVATEVQTEMQRGKDQMTAVMEVMQRHQDVLKTIASDIKPQ